MRAAAGDEWKVLTLTAETARNAVVALVVFGDKDTSEPIILGQSVGGLLHLGQSMGVLFHLDQSSLWVVCPTLTTLFHRDQSTDGLFHLGQSVGGLFHAGHIDEFKVRCPAINLHR